MTEEEKHLDYLKIGHYVVGALGMLFACFPLIHLFIGLAVVSGSFDMQSDSGNPPPVAFGWLFVVIGGLFFLIGQACAICIIFSGHFIAKRKNYTFSFVIACLLCAFFPFGTILGVFTIILLTKEPVKVLYGRI
ncbi:MAG: hypothetical protein ACSHX0_12900 [Akkermansiaceae bacterium]